MPSSERGGERRDCPAKETSPCRSAPETCADWPQAVGLKEGRVCTSSASSATRVQDVVKVTNSPHRTSPVHSIPGHSKPSGTCGESALISMKPTRSTRAAPALTPRSGVRPRGWESENLTCELQDNPHTTQMVLTLLQSLSVPCSVRPWPAPVHKRLHGGGVGAQHPAANQGPWLECIACLLHHCSEVTPMLHPHVRWSRCLG